MISLFGNLASGNVHKAQMILRYSNTDFRRVDVSQVREDTRRPEFLKLNPIGKIPAVLFDDGDILSESNAILFYFSQHTQLWPRDQRRQAEVMRWLFFEQYSHEPSLSVIRYLSRFANSPALHSEQIAVLRPKASHALDVVEKQLQSREWVATDNCSVADYALYPYTRLANESGFALENYPAIQRWLSTVEAQYNFLPMGDEGASEVLSFSEYFHGDS